jgi:hypothetical protein
VEEGAPGVLGSTRVCRAPALDAGTGQPGGVP